MSFQVSRWAWNVRGLSSREHHVLLLLADQADGDGYISRLSHSRIRTTCGFSKGSRHSFRVVKSLQQKGFVGEAIHRQGVHGNQISNAFQLNLSRYHPPDSAGKLLWRDSRDSVCHGKPERFTARLEAHAEGSTAYYEPEERALLVWVSNRYARQFFFDQRGELVVPLRNHPRFPVADLELLVLDTANNGNGPA